MPECIVQVDSAQDRDTTLTLRSLNAATIAATGAPPRGPRSSAASAACCAMLDAPLVLWLCTVEAALTKWRGPAR